jgi:sugar lactone lactonase YvrE
MVKKILIFFIGFICAWIIFSIGLKKVACQINIPPGVSFSTDGSSLYFFDRDEARIYKYNTQGKLTRTYVIKELGKDLQSK